MRVYGSKYGQIPTTSHSSVMRAARYEYHKIQKKTPRKVPYISSKYFIKDKIFINNFWEHLNQKSPKERVLRLKLYSCAIDLLRNSTIVPDTIFTDINKNINLHRFYGQTKSGSYFCVQVQESKRNNRKEFISVFPIKKPK